MIGSDKHLDAFGTRASDSILSATTQRLKDPAAFTVVVDAISRDIDAGRRVLLHCKLGQQRSPTVAVAYMMKAHGMDLETAIHHVRTKQPRALFQVITYMDLLRGLGTDLASASASSKDQ